LVFGDPAVVMHQLLMAVRNLHIRETWATWATWVVSVLVLSALAHSRLVVEVGVEVEECEEADARTEVCL